MQRRRRKAWLLEQFGDGSSAPCTMELHHPDCPGTLTLVNVSVDRYPLAGIDGGTYRRDNIRPVFMLCNSAGGGRLSKERNSVRSGHVSE